MNHLSNRINQLAESETLAMARKSRELKAQGKDVINLSLGEPDFHTPDYIKEAAKTALDENYTFYSPVAGYPELREAICLKLKRDNNLDFTPDQIVVSTGAKQSIANAVLALVNPGEEVLLPAPYWVSYKEIVKVADGVSVFIPSSIESNFKLTPAQLEAAITPRAKLIIFSSPCNPSGSVYTREELKALADVLERHPQVIIIADEIYEHINFIGKHESIAQFSHVRDRVIVINGVSKGFAMTGWRLGFLAAPVYIAKACDKLQGQFTSGTCTISQRAAITALGTDPNTPEMKTMLKAFRERRDLMLSLMADIPGMRLNHPDGAFYIFPDISYYFGKSDGTTTIRNANDLCMYLLNTVFVALVPGDAFGDPNCIRFSYATSTDKLTEAVKRIKAGLAKLKNRIDVTRYGISGVDTVYHNLSYEELFDHETRDTLEGYEKAWLTDTGSVTVDTGIFTGRSPKDKYIVDEDESRGNIWWASPTRKGSDNKPISEAVWKDLYLNTTSQLSGKKLYIQDGFAGTNPDSRLRIRIITEVAWQAHFVKNMFIRPTEEELAVFEPDYVMLNACKTVNPKWKEHGLNSEVYVAFNIKERLAVVGGSWYGGEIKKGFFSLMNYFLPLRGIAAMHCSANMGAAGDTAIFFGLSGTGKTTLSADPKRFLIGDDEHGWDNEGVFNFEGGCYAKMINLSREKEPDIWNAIKRDALLENVVFDPGTGVLDYNDGSKTENTRASYPIYHIRNIVKPQSKGGHPKKVIFLTADAFGVLPPVAKLTDDQTMYHFLSGYTAKLAGTERGILEPQPTFSSCFGAAFLLLHPTVYAQQLISKMREHGATAYLVNTGWIGGAYGVGHRIDIPVTRRIIDAILDGTLDSLEYTTTSVFRLQIPLTVPGIDPKLLDQRNLWPSKDAWEAAAKELAGKFIRNFESFTDNDDGKRLVAAGPVI